MKKRVIALLLCAMTLLAGCGAKDQFAEWEEDWASSEQTTVQEEGSESESIEEIPTELIGTVKVTKYNAEEQGLIRPYELSQKENDSPTVDWAYSLFKVLEAGIIKQEEADIDTIDLSEGNYIYYAINTEEDYLANPENDIMYMSSSYGMNITDTFYKGVPGFENIFNGLAGMGIVSETDVPFDESNKEKIGASIEGLMLGETQGTVKRENSDWIITGYSLADVTDIDAVKNAILQKGAVQIEYEFNEYAYENGSFFTKYSGGRDMRSAVVIGWDDSYAKTNFREDARPEHDGAWLVYDCMGAKLGSDGYIWVSYENGSTIAMISYDVVPRLRYGDVFSYSAIGYNEILKADGEEYTTAANIFETGADEEISAIGIMAFQPGQQVVVEVYTDVFDDNPTSGSLASTMTITSDAPGYKVYELDESVSVNAGEKFSVVLMYANDEKDKWSDGFGGIPVEGPAFDFSMGVDLNLYFTSAKGQSFARKNGEWYDLSEESSAEVFGERNVLNNVFMNVLMKKKSE